MTGKKKKKQNIIDLPEGYDENFRFHLSNHSIGMFEDCVAMFLYSRFFMPKLETRESDAITNTGAIFHDIAENNFDETFTDSILAFEPPATIEDIMAMSAIVKSRSYMAEPKYELEKEYVIDLNDAWSIKVIYDRIIERADGSVLIVDYKTGRAIRTKSDNRQGNLYCFAETVRRNILPGNVKAVFDYVRFRDCNPFEYPYSDYTHTQTTNYLRYMFNSIYRASKAFLEQKNSLMEKGKAEVEAVNLAIAKVPHSPGQHCSMCPKMGNCPAYRAYFVPDTLGETELPENMDTSRLIDEFKLLDEAIKVRELRLAAIKRSFMDIHTRYSKLIAEKKDIPPEMAKAMEVLTSKGKVIESNTSVVPISVYLEKQLPRLIEKALKGGHIKPKIDTVALRSGLSDMLRTVLPGTISASSLDKSILEEHPDIIKTYPRSPYYLLKK